MRAIAPSLVRRVEPQLGRRVARSSLVPNEKAALSGRLVTRVGPSSGVAAATGHADASKGKQDQRKAGGLRNRAATDT